MGNRILYGRTLRVIHISPKDKYHVYDIIFVFGLLIGYLRKLPDGPFISDWAVQPLNLKATLKMQENEIYDCPRLCSQ